MTSPSDSDPQALDDRSSLIARQGHLDEALFAAYSTGALLMRLYDAESRIRTYRRQIALDNLPPEDVAVRERWIAGETDQIIACRRELAARGRTIDVGEPYLPSDSD